MTDTYEKQLPAGFLDVFQVATLPSTHPGAFVEHAGKAVRATTEQGFLCFGQYRENYPQQPLQAVFSILIDNNTADDRYILLLDVYDHHSDRVIGKRLITRKDFPMANDFCIFTFDFIPPGPQARMEFRIFYMGYSYVRADKIAIIDPAQITIQEASQLPHIEVNIEEHLQPQQQPSDVDIRPWQLVRFGHGSGTISAYEITKHKIDTGKSEFLFQGALTIDASGSSQGYEDVLFIYTEWQSQFGPGRIWAAYFFPDSEGFVGVMIRESLHPASKFIMLEGHRVLYRSADGGAVTEKILTESHFPEEVRIERRGHNTNQYFDLFIERKGDKGITETIPLNLSDHLYVGPVIGKFRGTFQMCTKYKDSAATYKPEECQL